MVTSEYPHHCRGYAPHIHPVWLANSEHQLNHHHCRCIQYVLVKVLRWRNLTKERERELSSFSTRFNRFKDIHSIPFMHSLTGGSHQEQEQNLLISPNQQWGEEIIGMTLREKVSERSYLVSQFLRWFPRRNRLESQQHHLQDPDRRHESLNLCRFPLQQGTDSSVRQPRRRLSTLCGVQHDSVRNHTHRWCYSLWSHGKEFPNHLEVPMIDLCETRDIRQRFLPGPVTVAFITPSPASLVTTRNSATSPVRTPFGWMPRP